MTAVARVAAAFLIAAMAVVQALARLPTRVQRLSRVRRHLLPR